MRRLHMMERRAFLASALGAAALASHEAQAEGAAAQRAAPAPSPEPVVWPVVGKVWSGITSFAGHTDTVPDIVGRIGTPASLVIFTEGNHLMALLSDEIVGAFSVAQAKQTRKENVAAVAKAVNLQKVGKVASNASGVRPEFNPDARIIVLPAGKENPRREGTARWVRYRDLVASNTVGEFLQKHPRWHA